MVECDLAKVEVAGSNPVSRSRIFSALAFRRGFAVQDGYQSRFIRTRQWGAVAKW